MTRVLGIDTSAEACAVALLDADVERARVVAPMTHGHAAALMPMVERTAREAGCPLASLDIVGVCVGPGSFTGVRTGIAAARGLAIGSGARAVGVSALSAVAHRALADCPGSARVLCILDTRRRDYFAQAFRRSGVGETAPEALGSAAVYDDETLSALVRLQAGDGTLVVAGNAVPRFADACGPGLAGIVRAPGTGLPDPADIARLAAARAAAGENGLEDTLAALYLRPPEAKLPAKGGRLR